MMSSFLKQWLKISLFNLLLVSVLGVTLRYKIAFALPFIDQRNLIHGHSHFAFSGWISMTLMSLMVNYLSQEMGEAVQKKYRWILWANLLTAYGMLISLPIEGYGPVSICFSTLSIFASYIFAIVFWRDLNRLKEKHIGHYWYRAALIFNVISSAAPFFLAWMMATKHIHKDLYLASIYFFLHFQYNGWFFFACMGLFTTKLLINIPSYLLKRIFWCFALACVPAYFLSALWLPIPFWVYLLVILAAASQLLGWIQLVVHLKKHLVYFKSSFGLFARNLLLLSAIALSIKLLLQLCSTIPSLSTLAYGFRPIVIGYLHLVLLGVISLFLLAYISGCNHIVINRTFTTGAIIFASAVIINEVLLMIQGVTGMDYVAVPYMDRYLLTVSLFLFTGIFIMNLGQWKK